VSLTVNGQLRTVAVEPGTTLQRVLRDELGLTGTKNGCEIGDCGACTVIMDGRPVTACLVLATEAAGSEITTIEGLAQHGELHPLQKSFIKHGALQCGFCTSGMLMSCIELIERIAAPDEDEIKAALAGNLCRCGTYPRIRAAVHRAVELNGRPGQ